MIGEQIRVARKGKGLSQQKLSNLLHVGQSTVAGWETGFRTPDAETLSRIADILECSTDFLLGKSDTTVSPIPPDAKKEASAMSTAEALRIMVESKLGRPATQEELSLIDATTDGLIEHLREQRK